jgi:hypothetical protein
VWVCGGAERGHVLCRLNIQRLHYACACICHAMRSPMCLWVYLRVYANLTLVVHQVPQRGAHQAPNYLQASSSSFNSG